MRSVYAYWAVRKVMTSRLVRLATLASVLAFASARVSFIDVARNAEAMGGRFNVWVRYLTMASLNTETTVQITVAAAVILFALFAVDFGKSAKRIFKILRGR